MPKIFVDVFATSYIYRYFRICIDFFLSFVFTFLNILKFFKHFHLKCLSNCCLLSCYDKLSINHPKLIALNMSVFFWLQMRLNSKGR